VSDAIDPEVTELTSKATRQTIAAVESAADESYQLPSTANPVTE